MSAKNEKRAGKGPIMWMIGVLAAVAMVGALWLSVFQSFDVADCLYLTVFSAVLAGNSRGLVGRASWFVCLLWWGNQFMDALPAGCIQ